MKQFEDRIRRSLQNERASVDPAHLASFEQYLRSTKRKRRSFFIFWVLGAVMLLTTVGAMWLRETEGEVPKHKTEEHLLQVGAEPEVTDEQSEINIPSTQTNAPELMADKSHRDRATSTSALSRTRLNESRRAEQPAHKPFVEPERVIDQNSKVRTSPASAMTNRDQPVPPPVSDDQPFVAESGVENNIKDQRDPVNIVLIEGRAAEALMNSEGRAIDPATIPGQRNTIFSYGVVGSWFFTQPGKPVRAETGNGFQLGACLAAGLGPRWALQLGGGFKYVENGFAFDKQSVSTQYGFTQRSQANTLTIHKMYAWYGGVSALYKLSARHTAQAGITGYHVYGARGDITRTLAEDNQDPVTTRLENVWVSTNGLKEIAYEVAIGYRYRINEVLQAGLFFQRPISTIRKNGTGTEYAYMSDRYRFAGQIALYYNLKH